MDACELVWKTLARNGPVAALTNRVWDEALERRFCLCGAEIRAASCGQLGRGGAEVMHSLGTKAEEYA